MIIVTHDIEEALVLSDRVIVMRGNSGRLHRKFVINLPRPSCQTEISVQKWKELLLEELDLSIPERLSNEEATHRWQKYDFNNNPNPVPLRPRLYCPSQSIGG